MLTKYSHPYSNLLLIVSLLIPGFATAKPVINSVTGSIENSALIISGSGFTAKANPEPLFWWKADFGITPSALGRSTWDKTDISGSFSTKVVAPGSQKSVGFDHGKSSGVALSRVVFNSDRLYLHRKTYEDFDITKDYGIKPGTTLKTFNFKTVRFWSKQASLGVNNMHVNAQGAENSAFRITPENTDKTIWSNSFTNKPLFQIPKKWKVEEIEYKTSSIGIRNGIFKFYQNGILGTDNKFINRNTKQPDRYAWVSQSQVSNGAQSGSIMYYDSLYLDDTWHHVVICKSKTWTTCGNREIQIPTTWTDTKIIIHTNLGGFNTESSLFLYVVNKDGVANDNGYPLCPKCPLPPTLQ